MKSLKLFAFATVLTAATPAWAAIDYFSFKTCNKAVSSTTQELMAENEKLKEKLNRANPREIIKIETSAVTDDGIKYCTVTTAWYIK